MLFSLAGNSVPSHAILNIGAATPTFAGAVSFAVRDSSTLPTTGSITLITGTNIPDATSTSGLSLVSGAYGLFRIASNSLFLDFARAPIATDCGNTTIRIPVSPGVANMQALCDSTDSLTAASDISITQEKIAIVYRGTQAGGSGNVRSIVNTGTGGEIHIESGGVARTDNGAGTAVDALKLSNAQWGTVRVVLASGTSVSNADTTTGSDAIDVSVSSGDVSISLAGDTSAVAGNAVRVYSAGDVDIDVTGGTHTSSRSAIFVAIGDSGPIDVDITGGVLHGGSSSAAVIDLQGIDGADELTIGSGAVVCRGSYSASTCNPGASGNAVFLGKAGVQSGSVTFKNSGSIWGGVSVSRLTIGSTVTNEATGAIVGAFTGGSGNDVVTNAGTWTIAQNFDFAGGTDSFTNSGTLIVHHSGSALAMNNLETFTLSLGGTLRFSLASNSIPSHAILDVGGATPTLAGTIAFMTRDSSTMPTTGSITLLSATSLPDGTSTGNLSLSGAYGLFRVESNSLILDLARAPISTTCGNTTIRAPVSPGVANMQALCNSSDSLTAASDISVTADKVAIVFQGTQVGGSGNVRSISNTGAGGEIHIESGGVARTTAGTAVTLTDTETNTARRLVIAANTSISNTHTGSLSYGILASGGGDLSASIAGSVSAVGAAAIDFSGSSIDLDITGGTHTSPKNVLLVGSSVFDVDITGGVLHGGSATDAIIRLRGRGGADTLDISSGVVVCSGRYAAGTCTAGSGLAVSLEKTGTQAGSVTFRNAGSIFGDISVSTVTIGSTITNSSGGAIAGSFTGGTGNDVVSNVGTWTMSKNFDFGTRSGDTDFFANSGTFIVHYAGTTLAMNNLETFTLESSGTLRFSLASNTLPSHALLSIGGATSTFAGTIDLVARDSSTLPTSGSITLLSATSLPDATSTSALGLSGAYGLFRIAGNSLILDFARAPISTTCGNTTIRTPVSPGVANMEALCDSTDSLNANTDISVTADKIAIFYRGTQAGGTGNVRSISNTGEGGEIHIESGGVARTTAGNAVNLVDTEGSDALRLVFACRHVRFQYAYWHTESCHLSVGVTASISTSIAGRHLCGRGLCDCS